MLPACAATEDMLMMRPQWRARIPGSTACVTRKHDVRLDAIMSFQLSSVICSMDWIRILPALFTRISIGPSCDSAARTSSRHVSRARNISLDGSGASSQLFEFRAPRSRHHRGARDN